MKEAKIIHVILDLAIFVSLAIALKVIIQLGQTPGYSWFLGVVLAVHTYTSAYRFRKERKNNVKDDIPPGSWTAPQKDCDQEDHIERQTEPTTRPAFSEHEK